MAVIFSATSQRTFLKSVQMALRSVGISVPGTLVSPDRNVAMAMDAVNNALSVVWNFDDWEFRRDWAEIELVATQMWYLVDERFAEMMSPPQSEFSAPTIEFRDYERLMKDYPGLRFPPPDFISGTLAAELVAATNYHGTPHLWTYAGGSIGFYPVPDADFVEECPVLSYSFAKTLPELVGDNDTLEIDKNLELAHAFLSSSGLKESLEYPDFNVDYERGLQILKKAANRRLFKGGRDFYLHPQDR